MKRKPQRVPDFSTAKKPASSAKGALPAPATDKVAPAAPRPVAKPQATSSKSGRRGT
jgi:hypothetical protein